MDPSVGVINWIWLLFWPWLGSGLGSTSRWFGWDLRPGPSCMGGVMLVGSHGESLGMGVEGLGVSSHSLAIPSTRKRVRPWGNMGWLPNSLSTSNQTCFFLCFSSVGVGASSHCTLFLEWQALGCRWRSSMEQLSCSSAGQDYWGLGEGDWCWLWHWGEELWCHFDLSLPLEWKHHFLDPDHPARVSSLGHLADSTPRVQLRGTGLWGGMAACASPASCSGPSQSSFTLQASLGHMLGEFLTQLPHAFILLSAGEYAGHHYMLSPVDLFINL